MTGGSNRVPEAPRIGGLSARKCITPYKRQYIGVVALPPNHKWLQGITIIGNSQRRGRATRGNASCNASFGRIVKCERTLLPAPRLEFVEKTKNTNIAYIQYYEKEKEFGGIFWQ